VRVCAADQLSAECNAVTPENPPSYGEACESAPNACGDTSAGQVGCDGACDAQPPAAIDTDGDATPDCIDQCPTDPAKTEPGTCGCGVPETSSATFYRDGDGDGFGNATDPVQACTAPAGYVADGADCDDTRASVHPGAAERCNGRDDDCDAVVDENVDKDADGVEDCSADRCGKTKADNEYLLPVPLLRLLPNHWMVKRTESGLAWVTKLEKGKKGPDFQPTLAYTHGCSCKQILNEHPPFDDKLEVLGQYLFGCASGTLKSWHER
jgi:hypothetical protein